MKAGWKFVCGLFCLLVASATAAAEPANPEHVDYVQDIKPILSRRCYSCHGALKQKSDLRLDTAALALKGGQSGPAIVAGQSAESLLIEAVTGEGGVAKMPPEGDPLTAEQIAKLKAWIDQGAKAPVEAIPQDPARHWSYQAPVRPAVPAAQNAGWVRNPIDAFIAAEHERRKLVPSPEASKQTLLRRVYLDLIGLPPTRAEMQAFLADTSADAYDRVVDRLLDSPHYGERWGRHWMDVWRYSDWDGHGAEVRESQPHIWRWRDWIIQSLNADKPYSEMIVEMLAGDELAPDNPDVVRATGFLVRNWYKFNRNVWIDFSIEHTSKAFLGTTMNCARCHDHMYDPISQQEYYKFRAFFEPHDIRTDRVPGQADTTKDGLVQVYDANPAAPTFVFARGDEKNPDKDHPVSAALPGVLAKAELPLASIPLPATAYYPGLRPHAQAEALNQARSEVEKSKAGRQDALAKVELAKKKLADFAATQATAAAATAPAVPATPLFADEFAAAKPELWTLGAGQWEYAGGKLLQKDPRDAITQALSVRTHPADFIARFRFKTTGGKVYKSVGLSFDAFEDRDFWAAYLSATGKLSVFRRVNGQDQYPADANRNYPVELNREYELQVAVRGLLLNVSVNGKLEFVYKLTGDRRKDGRIALWTYDATAEFLRAQVEEMPASYAMYEKAGDAPVPVSEADLKLAVVQAEQSQALAEKTLATAEAALTWTVNRIAADQANYANPPAPQAKDLSLIAGGAERKHAFLLAEQNLLAAEHKLSTARALPNPADDKTKKAVADAEAAVAAATKARDAAREALAQPSEAYTRFGPVYPQTTSGRRLALARWIADRNNPLTARVAINHMWLRHFATPLVPTVFDFGLNGKPPTHPELLDWLAVELMEPSTTSPGGSLGATGPWRMKHIHRLIVTSMTYRQQSSAAPTIEPNRQIDPDNIALWRMNVRRMEAEIIRDSTLYVAGKLDNTMSGAELDENTGMTATRRSVYFRNSKEKKMTFLDLFDRPNVVECYRRSESVVPQQALAMANSPLSLAQARVLAKSLSAEAGATTDAATSEKFITIAFEQILCRPPTAAERSECQTFLVEQAGRFANPTTLTQFKTGTPSSVPAASDPQQRARENLVHVLLNHNDFLTVR
ncbi:MAG: PSD1 domain-containing protein [Planctomycetes bacterium]|nr:PSD1 domain-containing protein [Planctomycetota bacterium]